MGWIWVWENRAARIDCIWIDHSHLYCICRLWKPFLFLWLHPHRKQPAVMWWPESTGSQGDLWENKNVGDTKWPGLRMNFSQTFLQSGRLTTSDSTGYQWVTHDRCHRNHCELSQLVACTHSSLVDTLSLCTHMLMFAPLNVLGCGATAALKSLTAECLVHMCLSHATTPSHPTPPHPTLKQIQETTPHHQEWEMSGFLFSFC